jgi:nitrogenase molybdenum-iron protein beta chain
MSSESNTLIYPEVAESPRFTCALGGAYAATLATYGNVPILHSGAGCGMANAHGLTFASGLNTGGAQGTTSTPCSCLVEEHVIFGGENKLRNLVKSTIEVMQGDMFTVISGCVPALIGDDVDAVVQEFKDKATVLHVKTAGFEGTSYNGYEAFFDAVTDQLLEKRDVETNLVNILGIVPNQHVFWKGDLEIIKQLLGKIGISVNTIFLDFEGVQSLKKIPSAKLNLVLSPWVGIKSAEKLEKQFGTPFEVFHSVPVGPKESSIFLSKVGEKLGISQEIINKVIEDEEKKAYRYSEYLSEAFMISVPHAYLGVVADSRTAIELVKYTTNELGWNPEIVIITDNPPEEYRDSIVRNLTEGLEGVVIPEVVFEIDSHKIRLELNKHTLQVLLASSLEKYIAEEELSSIHLSIAYPVYDKVIVDRSYAGYRGGIALFEDLTATFAGPL